MSTLQLRLYSLGCVFNTLDLARRISEITRRHWFTWKLNTKWIITKITLSWALKEFVTRIHAFSHWGRVTHICVNKLTIIGLNNGLSPGRHQAIIWTNAGALLIGPIGTDYNENFINSNFIHFHSRNSILVCLTNGVHFFLGLNV